MRNFSIQIRIPGRVTANTPTLGESGIQTPPAVLRPAGTVFQAGSIPMTAIVFLSENCPASVLIAASLQLVGD
jgi:hypothetical protein